MMRLKLSYGPEVSTYEFKKIQGKFISFMEMAPILHQINISNDFQPGWKYVSSDTGRGTYYMGCCYITGLERLTRKQLQEILQNIDTDLGREVEGATIADCVCEVKTKLDCFISYIASKSPIMMNDLSWKWGNLKKFEKCLGELEQGVSHNLLN